jgi:hypothetical protein
MYNSNLLLFTNTIEMTSFQKIIYAFSVVASIVPSLLVVLSFSFQILAFQSYNQLYATGQITHDIIFHCQKECSLYEVLTVLWMGGLAALL